MQNIEFNVFSINYNSFVSKLAINKIKECTKKYTNVEETKTEETVVKNEEAVQNPFVESKTDKTEESKEPKLEETKEQKTEEVKKTQDAEKQKTDKTESPQISEASEEKVESNVDVKTPELQTQKTIVEVQKETAPPQKLEKAEKVQEENSGFKRKQIIDMDDIIRGLKEKEEELEKQLPSLRKLYISGIIEREEYDFLVKSVVVKIKELDRKIDYEIELAKIKECKESIEEKISEALLKGELRDKTQKALKTLDHIYNDGIIDQKTYIDGRTQILVREKKVCELIKKIDDILDKYVKESEERTKEHVETD
ncbi:MAG: hypothetical protein KAQ92_00920, partial [Candidatus Aenigmarchaeota archaeon]|nr:hypothetical protein [Candidatus Aenigmarchaeota archaeon]